MTRGAQRGEGFMTSSHPWDGYQAACRFDHNAVGRLVGFRQQCSSHDFTTSAFGRLQLGFPSCCKLLLGFVSAPRSTMPAKKDVASSNAAGPRGNGGSRLPYLGKPIEVLNDLYSSQYRTGTDGVQHLEYAVQVGPLPAGGGAKGHVLVRGPWAGLSEHPKRDFCPNYSVKLPGSHKRGRLVEWVKKASFDRLNKLFEIIAIERHHQTLLSARNLLVVVREPQPYVLNILPRRLPKVVVPREHFVLKDLPFYEKAREADAKACQELLDQWEEKR
ncbi:hypothetical protein CK203_024651 [Vitis vinifera]|uniref:Uncharacterized protein n=1 Tax=Vitis vinifera TaxID=29760 RepID=A0A438IUC0_VITVI|nr:hypothetical protein CK203_024651 [Vitis vinifera]